MFNKTLLAKQMWKVVMNLDSLAATIMKAKYFPNCSIMEANVGSRPSLVWRSILASKDLIEDGAIWRIGDGRSVKIWGDKWLPRTKSSMVYSPRISNLQNMKVDELIDREEKQWRSSLINTLFIPKEAQTILSIPLSPFFPQDRLIWKGKGCRDSNMCPICLREEESIAHACWDCLAARDVWGGCRGKLQKCGTGERDFLQIFKEVSMRCEKNEVELFAVVARKIWLRRNGIVHGESFTHPTQLLKEAETALAEYQRCSPKGGGVGEYREKE
jgi:hypothetical protein